MWRAPHRPDNAITQTYNDGIVQIYDMADNADPGYQPQTVLTLSEKLPFAERRVGVTRYYEAAQNQIQIDRVLRVPRRPITSQQIATVGDGVQYRIDQVQTADTYPPSVDISLSRILQNYPVAGGEEDGQWQK